MKNLLMIFGLLLTVDSYCFYDTIKAVSTISNVKVLSEGTLITRSTPVKLSAGDYILQFDQFPAEVEENDIRVDSIIGLQVVSIENKKQTRNGHFLTSWDELDQVKNEISEILIQLKQLDKDEKSLIDLKSFANQRNLSVNEIIYFQESYQKQGAEIRRNRAEAYQTLHQLRERMNGLHSSIRRSPVGESTKNLLYITLMVEDSVDDQLQISYLLRLKSDSSSLQNPEEGLAFNENIFPIELKGKVTGERFNEPIVFANVELLREGELIYSTTTDYQGYFSLEIPSLNAYQLIVRYAGYRKKKVRNLVVQNQTNQMPIHLVIKRKLTPMEMMSYAIPIVNIVTATLE